MRIVRVVLPSIIWIALTVLSSALIQSLPAEDSATEDSAVQQAAAARIGRQIFLDTGLSRPSGQGCVSCHQPEAAFADPRPVSPGAVSGRKGIRNSPTLMYAALIPGLAYDEISRVVGVSKGTVMSRLHYARKHLQKVLRPYVEVEIPRAAISAQ